MFMDKEGEKHLNDYFGGNQVAGIMLYGAIGMELFLTEIWPGKFVLEEKFLEIFDKRERVKRGEEDHPDNDSSLSNIKGSTDEYRGVADEPSHNSSNSRHVDCKVTVEKKIIQDFIN